MLPLGGEEEKEGGEAFFSRHYNDKADQASLLRVQIRSNSACPCSPLIFFPGLKGPVFHGRAGFLVRPWDGVFIGLVLYLFAAGPLS